jgi:hypothetical protein
VKQAIDEALERLRGTGAEVKGGGDPNHGPMAAEALAALGRDDAVVKWTNRYCQALGAMPAGTTPIADENWREALGVIGRIGDWAAFFRAKLAEAPWPAVFAQWVDRLVRGTVSAGSHGLIRTAHAIRALEDAETPLRIEELGVALGYWAAYYRELPGIPRLAGALDVGEAFRQVPLLMRGRTRRGMPRELILHVADSHAEFTAAVDRLAEPESVDHALSALTEAGARLYLANASRQPLVLLHTVTAPAALRLLLPHLPTALHKTALAYVWQVVAAECAAYADERAVGRDDATPLERSVLVEQAVETVDPHAIKFTEACLREFQLNPRPAYLAAAEDWVTRLRRSKSWSDAERAAAGIAFR